MYTPQWPLTGYEHTEYTEEEMISASGVKPGDNLLSLSSSDVKERLKNSYPYINKVDVKKSFPSTLKISLEFYKPVMALELAEDVFLLSSDGKVLGAASEEQIENERYCYIATPFIVNCIEGQKLELKSKDGFEILVDVYSAFEKSSIAERLTRLDVTDKYNVKAVIDGRFNVTFGSFEQSDEKAGLLADVLKGNMWTDASGEIDVSDISSAVVRLTGASAT